MTWIPCHRCHSHICVCPSRTSTGWQQTFAQPLSDEDVERIARRIARRVAELLKAELAVKGGA